MTAENIQTDSVGREETFTLPINMLLSLVNSLNCEDPARQQVLEYIKTYKTRVAKKGHVSEGFYICEDGSLAFDPDLLWEAVYRGKIETYLTSAEINYKNMLKALEGIEGFQCNRNKLLGRLPQMLIDSRLGDGLPLSEKAKKLLLRLQLLLEEEKKLIDAETNER